MDPLFPTTAIESTVARGGQPSPFNTTQRKPDVNSKLRKEYHGPVVKSRIPRRNLSFWPLPFTLFSSVASGSWIVHQWSDVGKLLDRKAKLVLNYLVPRNFGRMMVHSQRRVLLDGLRIYCIQQPQRNFDYQTRLYEPLGSGKLYRMLKTLLSHAQCIE